MCRATAQPRQRLLLALGVGGNLLRLTFFKHADFLLLALSGLPVIDLEGLGIFLPIGIYFGTCTQIAFLVDAYRAAASR